jgi:hypothetical protein
VLLDSAIFDLQRVQIIPGQEHFSRHRHTRTRHTP